MYHFDRALLNEACFSPSVRGRGSAWQVASHMNGEKNTASVRFISLESADAVGYEAALLVAEQLARKPNASIVFPTGRTPLPMYAALRAMRGLDWRQSRLFQLDEYIPPSGSPAVESEWPYESFAAFMKRELWNQIEARIFDMNDYSHSPNAYEALVTQDEGPDLVILGIGGNGHIAFNEPGAPPDSESRLVDLAEQTRLDNFGSQVDERYPHQAVTLGLKPILAAKHILLLATGLGKREIMQTAFSPKTPPTENCPASWLKLHPNVTVITDFEVFPALD